MDAIRTARRQVTIPVSVAGRPPCRFARSSSGAGWPSRRYLVGWKRDGHRVRALGVDLGAKRIGLAISDPTGTLARPLATLAIGQADAVEQVTREVVRLAAEDDGLSVIVVGVPTTLQGEPSEGTARASRFMEALRLRTAIPVVGEDERLSSREAEQRLAIRERDWRKRKQKLDAAAAAVFLQDFLDRGQTDSR